MALEAKLAGTHIFVRNGHYVGLEKLQNLLGVHPNGIHSIQVTDNGALIKVVRHGMQTINTPGLYEPVEVRSVRGKVTMRVGTEYSVEPYNGSMVFHIELPKRAKAAVNSQGQEMIFRHSTAKRSRPGQIWKP